MPRARMHRGSTASRRLVMSHAARVRARECRRVRSGHAREVCPLSCSLCSTCCSQVGRQVLEQLLLVLPLSSNRVRAVRAAVGRRPQRAPWEASGLLVGEMRGSVVPMSNVHAHGRPAGGAVAAGGGASAERVGDA